MVALAVLSAFKILELIQCSWWLIFAAAFFIEMLTGENQ